MDRSLNRHIGPLAAMAIACGAMIAGLLVLPAMAFKMTGGAVYLAFGLAGLLFLPAVFSSAEMATVMPESGGDYQFIDRALGPLASTISGLGMYVALLFKTAFALVGFVAYLKLILPVADGYITTVAAVMAIALVVLNFLGVEKACTAQVLMMAVVLTGLTGFVLYGSARFEGSLLTPFFSHGGGGFFAATAFAFISYAGVIKIVSVGEEIRDPQRTIPLSLIASLLVMILLYVTSIYVLVGTVPADVLTSTTYIRAPFAAAGSVYFDWYGELAMVLLSGTALLAMANAGVLASSRYPFAMASRGQLPEVLKNVHKNLQTPHASIGVTGLVLVGAILFLPVIQIAKLASGFQIIVLVFLNASLVILREADTEWYRPTYKAPFYPYTQFAGIFGGLAMIGFLGVVPVMVVGLTVISGGIWYWFYARSQTNRRGAMAQLLGYDLVHHRNFVPPNDPTSEHRPLVIPAFLPSCQSTELEHRLRVMDRVMPREMYFDVPVFIERPDKTSRSKHHSARRAVENRLRWLGRDMQRRLRTTRAETLNAHNDFCDYIDNHCVEGAVLPDRSDGRYWAHSPWWEGRELTTPIHQYHPNDSHQLPESIVVVARPPVRPGVRTILRTLAERPDVDLTVQLSLNAPVLTATEPEGQKIPHDMLNLQYRSDEQFGTIDRPCDLVVTFQALELTVECEPTCGAIRTPYSGAVSKPPGPYVDSAILAAHAQRHYPDSKIVDSRCSMISPYRPVGSYDHDQ